MNCQRPRVLLIYAVGCSRWMSYLKRLFADWTLHYWQKVCAYRSERRRRMENARRRIRLLSLLWGWIQTTSKKRLLITQPASLLTHKQSRLAAGWWHRYASTITFLASCPMVAINRLKLSIMASNHSSRNWNKFDFAPTGGIGDIPSGDSEAFFDEFVRGFLSSTFAIKLNIFSTVRSKMFSPVCRCFLTNKWVTYWLNNSDTISSPCSASRPQLVLTVVQWVLTAPT